MVTTVEQQKHVHSGDHLEVASSNADDATAIHEHESKKA